MGSRRLLSPLGRERGELDESPGRARRQAERVGHGGEGVRARHVAWLDQADMADAVDGRHRDVSASSEQGGLEVGGVGIARPGDQADGRD
ncbi:MAG: hypothetical protein ACRDNN_04810, partial [Gaiellaceae bacterium]